MPISPLRERPDMTQTPVARRRQQNDLAASRRTEENRPQRNRPVRRQRQAPRETGREEERRPARKAATAQKERAELRNRNDQNVPTPQPLNPAKGMINITV